MELMQVIAAFTFGVAFVAVAIVLAICFPSPTAFQAFIFRVVLGLAASGVAAMIPGFVTFNFQPAVDMLIRAGGASAVFVLVFFFNPAVLPASPLSFAEKAVVFRHLDLVSGRIPGQPAALLPTALSLPSATLTALYTRLL